MSGYENFESESSGLMLVGIQGGHFFIHSFEKTGETNGAIIFCCKKFNLEKQKTSKIKARQKVEDEPENLTKGTNFFQK